MGHSRNPSSRFIARVAAGFLCFAAAAFAQDAANLAPPDTATYIQLNDLAALRASLQGDPLFRPLFDPQSPVNRHGDAAWKHVEQALGLTREEIFDRYFGKKVAVLSATDQPNGPGVVLSAIAEPDAASGVAKLGLEKESQVGPFAVYRTMDGGGRIGLTPGWMALGPGTEHAFMDRVLQSIGTAGPTLADDPAFRKWAGKLPNAGPIFLFSRDPATSQHHALSLRLDGLDWTLDYAGSSPPLRAALASLGDAAPLDFGPLPDTTLAAVTLNLYSPRVDPRLAERVDRLLAPKTLANDIVPKLAAPIVLGLGEVEGEAVDPTLGIPVPALVIAVKMRDATVAADLDRLLGSLVNAVNLAAAARQFEPIPLTLAGEGDAAYHVVDLGGPLSRRLNTPKYAGLLRIAYGRVGDWYVLTTHESFFLRCRDTLAHPARGLSSAEDVRSLLSTTAADPLATAVVRSPKLGAHLRALLAHVKETQPALVELKPLQDLGRLADLLHAYRGVSIQSHRDEPESVRATVKLLRMPEAR